MKKIILVLLFIPSLTIFAQTYEENKELAEYMLFDHLFLEEQSLLASMGEVRISQNQSGKAQIVRITAQMDQTTQNTGILGLGFTGNEAGNWTWDLYFEGDEVLFLYYLMKDDLNEAYRNAYSSVNENYILSAGTTDGAHRKDNYWAGELSMAYKDLFRFNIKQGQIFYEHAPIISGLGDVEDTSRLRNVVGLTVYPQALFPNMLLLKSLEELSFNLFSQDALDPRGVDFIQRFAFPEIRSFLVTREGYSRLREIGFFQVYGQSYYPFLPLAGEFKWEADPDPDMTLTNTYSFYGLDVLTLLLSLTGTSLMDEENVEDKGLVFSFLLGRESRQYTDNLTAVFPDLPSVEGWAGKLLLAINTSGTSLYFDLSTNISSILDEWDDGFNIKIRLGGKFDKN